MKLTLRFKGGAGSGHHGHSGRPGKRGGSAPSGGGSGSGSGNNAASMRKLSATALDEINMLSVGESYKFGDGSIITRTNDGYSAARPGIPNAATGIITTTSRGKYLATAYDSVGGYSHHAYRPTLADAVKWYGRR